MKICNEITFSEAYTISKSPSIVVPMPIAGPFTIAINSLGKVISASIKFL